MNLFELAIVVSAVDKATATLQGVKNGVAAVASAGEKMRAWGQQAQVGGALMSGASQKIIAGFESIVAPANDVEDSLTKVRTVLTPMSGTMTQALGKMQNAALDWSSAHTDAASKFLDTTYMMISAGLNETASVEATRTAMTVAKATMGEATEAANIIGTAYNNMADKTKPASDEIGRLGDIITKTQQNFQFANMGQLAQGLQAAMGSAIASRVEFSQLNATIGLLNNKGVQGAEAGTALSMAMSKMAGASKAVGFEMAKTKDGGLDLVGTITNIEKKFGAASAMSEATKAKLKTAFGEEVWNKINVLVGSSAELADGLGKVRDSAGAAATAAALMTGTGSGKMAIMQNQLVGLKVVLADQLRPSIEAVAGHTANAIAAFMGFAKAHPELIRTAGTIAMVAAAVMGVVGPILMFVGGIGMIGGYVASGAAMLASFGGALLGLIPGIISATVAAWGFAAALLANPITWIVLAVVAAAALIYIYWDPIKKFFIAMWAVIKAAFVSAWAATVSAWNGGVAWFSNLWASIKGAFLSAWGAIAGAWNGVVGFFLGIWNNIKSAFQESFIKGVIAVWSYFSPIGLLIRAFAAVWPWLQGLGPKVLNAFAALGGMIVGFYASIGRAALGLLAQAWSAIRSAWSGVVGWFQALPGRVMAGLQALGMAAVMLLASVGARIVAALTAAFTWYISLPGRILSALMGLPAMVGGVFVSVKDWVFGVLSSIAARLAGFFLGGIRNDLNAVLAWLSSFSLFQAGMNVLNTLTAGIKAAANAPIEAVMAVVTKVRALLPFSPAKAGPLKDLHRVRLIETIAETVRAAPLVAAVSGAAAMAVGAMPRATIPAIAPMSITTSGPSTRQGATRPPDGGDAPGDGAISVNFYISGNADASTVASLERWARDNGRLLHSVVKQADERDKRSNLG
jgi:TP901 family phage tail tape measure protein